MIGILVTREQPSWYPALLTMHWPIATVRALTVYYVSSITMSINGLLIWILDFLLRPQLQQTEVALAWLN